MAQHYKNESITKSRLKVFMGWENFNPKGNVAPGRMDQNLCGRLWTHHNRLAVKLSVTSRQNTLHRPSRDILESYEYRPAKVGDSFGPSFSTHVFRLDITVPQSLHGHPVHLLWDSNSEAMVLTEDGVPRQGLVGGDHWARRADYALFPDRPNSVGQRDERIRVYVEITCNGLFGAGRGGDIEPPDMNKHYSLDECCVAAFDPLAWDLLHDVTMLSSLAEHLPDTPRRAQALHIANKVVNAVDVSDSTTYVAGRKVAAEYFACRNGDAQTIVHSVLHSHIDLAWLWPMASTPAKGGRTFATHLRLMDEYPDCIYVQSQAQLYEWVKDRYPKIWKQVCERVREGRFVPVGATWVEMDCNIPSGESLVRQFVVGQDFFESNFGLRCKEFWLPDTFGYAGQLPQIMKGCGVDYFMTQKLSWNLFNKFPHSTFIWEGMDGSRVIAHMPPADTYNAQAFPEEVLRTANKNKDAGVLNSAMMLVGHGDGGGGASPAMLESMKRMYDVDGMPKVQFSTPRRFFQEVTKREDELPRWVGELYFELHRGTYTTQAKTKQNNRQCEVLLRDLEILSSQAAIVSELVEKKFTYPQELLKKCWKLVLKNCFHDTLPGSCIGLVYDETTRDYKFVLERCSDALSNALSFIEENFSTTKQESMHDSEESMVEYGTTGGLYGHRNGATSAATTGLLFVRSTPWKSVETRPLVIEVDSESASLDPDVYSQQTCSGAMTSNIQLTAPAYWASKVLVALKTRPNGMGFVINPELIMKRDLPESGAFATIESETVNDTLEYVLSNSRVKARISGTGILKSLLLTSSDGGRREAIKQPSPANRPDDVGGNMFVIYDDVPQFWCGWDTEVYSFEKYTRVEPACTTSVLDKGPLQVGVYLKYPPTRAGTIIEQCITLRADSARLDFRTKIDWKESRKIIRVLFNTLVRSPQASYDAQFGYVQRPTTFNHSWEIAKFEAVGHQYCDISERGFGVALLNDCKYGYSVRDSTMRLSLLRASKSPDDNADIGVHLMTYSLLTHWDSFPTQAVLEEAADLNWPPLLRTAQKDDATRSVMRNSEWMFQVAPERSGNGLESVMISAIKQAEKQSGILIIRLYECLGARGISCLKCPLGMTVVTVKECNMLEDPDSDMGADIVVRNAKPEGTGGRTEVLLPFTPFQIRTLMIQYCA